MSAVRELVRPMAHRGLHVRETGVIENTAGAFAAAIAKGYGIECDLQAARYFEPVVFHDQRLERLTEGRGLVKNVNASELRRLAMHGTSDRILKLTELLELVGGRVPLLIEIKSDWQDGHAFEHVIAARLRDYKGPYGLMSFDPRRVVPFGNLLPGVPRGIVAGGIREDSHMPAWIKRWQASDLWQNDLVTPDFVAYFVGGLAAAAKALEARPKGMPLFTWTVRTDADRFMARRYADAMIFEGFEP
jgi:glycerophosphoryl diester phosphodiesterase